MASNELTGTLCADVPGHITEEEFMSIENPCNLNSCKEMCFQDEVVDVKLLMK